MNIGKTSVVECPDNHSEIFISYLTVYREHWPEAITGIGMLWSCICLCRVSITMEGKLMSGAVELSSMLC